MIFALLPESARVIAFLEERRSPIARVVLRWCDSRHFAAVARL
jgi:hypothetical protein